MSTTHTPPATSRIAIVTPRFIGLDAFYDLVIRTRTNTYAADGSYYGESESRYEMATVGSITGIKEMLRKSGYTIHGDFTQRVNTYGTKAEFEATITIKKGAK